MHRQQVEADQEREQFLTGLGFRVIRFTNAQVLEQTEQVLQQILDSLCRSEPDISNSIASKGTPSSKSHAFRDFGEGVTVRRRGSGQLTMVIVRRTAG